MAETARRKLTAADLKPRAAQPMSPAPAKSAPKRAKPSTAAPEAKPVEPKKPTRKQRAAKRRKRVRQQRKKLPMVSELFASWEEKYPGAFGRPRKPLAIGVHRQLLAESGCTPAVLRLAMKRWTSKLSYLSAVATGGPRYALDGTICGEVTESDQAEAVARIAAREKRREAVRSRSIEAGEARGANAQA